MNPQTAPQSPTISDLFSKYKATNPFPVGTKASIPPEKDWYSSIKTPVTSDSSYGQTMNNLSSEFGSNFESGTADAVSGALNSLKGDITKPLYPGQQAMGGIPDLAQLLLSPLVGEVKGIGGLVSHLIPDQVATSQPVSAGLDMVSSLTSKLKELETAHPIASKFITDAVNDILLATGEKPVTEGISGGLSDLGTTATNMGTGIKNTVEGVGNAMSEIPGKVGNTLENVTGSLNPKNILGKVENLVAEPLSPQYETTLRRTTPQTFDEYAEVAQRAARDYKSPTPLELAGQKAQGALDTIQRKLDTVGSQKQAVLNKAAVGNKPVGNIVVKFRQDLQNYLKGKTTVEGDAKLFRDINTEAAKLGANPSASQVDKFIDFVQDRIYTGGRDLTVPITDQSTGALRQMTGKLNESLKSQLPESYRNLNAIYADMIDVRNELNTKLGNGGEKGGALMKRVFSPSDAGTKQLFQKVKDLTGVDLVDEATLARMMMEIAGDNRQASILQQLNIPPMTKSGIMSRIWEEVTKSFNTPEARLKRARELLLQGNAK